MFAFLIHFNLQRQAYSVQITISDCLIHKNINIFFIDRIRADLVITVNFNNLTPD